MIDEDGVKKLIEEWVKAGSEVDRLTLELNRTKDALSKAKADMVTALVPAGTKLKEVFNFRVGTRYLSVAVDGQGRAQAYWRDRLKDGVFPFDPDPVEVEALPAERAVRQPARPR